MAWKTTKAAVFGAMIALAAASANAFRFPGAIILPLETAPPPAGEDVAAYAARVLSSEAEVFRTWLRASGDDPTIYYDYPGFLGWRKSEEQWLLEDLVGNERGREAVAAACREALAGDDPYLKVVAYNLLSDVAFEAACREPRTGNGRDLDALAVKFFFEMGGGTADAYLADLYESCGEGDGDVLMFAFVVDGVLHPGRDEGPVAEAEELYARLERDLFGDDRGARLKAAKSIAHILSDRTRALAASGMRSPDVDVRRWCVIRLAYAYDRPAEDRYLYEALVAALRDEDPLVRCLAAQGCFNTCDARVAEPLLELLDDGEVLVRRAAAASLSWLLEYKPAAGKGVSKKLLKRLKAEDDGVTLYFLAAAYRAATAKE